VDVHPFGLLMIAIGAAVFLLAPRIARADEARSNVFWGRLSPYKKWPAGTRTYTRVTQQVLSAAFVVLGILVLFGVLGS
jgi:hypothetical protein